MSTNRAGRGFRSSSVPHVSRLLWPSSNQHLHSPGNLSGVCSAMQRLGIVSVVQLPLAAWRFCSGTRLSTWNCRLEEWMQPCRTTSTPHMSRALLEHCPDIHVPFPALTGSRYCFRGISLLANRRLAATHCSPTEATKSSVAGPARPLSI